MSIHLLRSLLVDSTLKDIKNCIVTTTRANIVNASFLQNSDEVVNRACKKEKLNIKQSCSKRPVNIDLSKIFVWERVKFLLSQFNSSICFSWYTIIYAASLTIARL